MTNFVVEMMQLAHHHDPSELEINADLLDTAVTLIQATEPTHFEECYDILLENGCDASAAFGEPVDEATDDAYAAYICYCGSY